jgi:hypothetical protein
MLLDISFNASKDMYKCMGNVLDSAYGVCRMEGVSLKYWLSFVIKMKRKEPSVRTGFIAVRT